MLYWNKSCCCCCCFFLLLQISQVPGEEVKLKGTRSHKAACWLTGVLRRGGGKRFFLSPVLSLCSSKSQTEVYETDLELTWLLKHCRLNICACDMSVRALRKGAVSWRWMTKMGGKKTETGHHYWIDYFCLYVCRGCLVLTGTRQFFFSMSRILERYNVSSDFLGPNRQETFRLGYAVVV